MKFVAATLLVTGCVLGLEEDNDVLGLGEREADKESRLMKETELKDKMVEQKEMMTANPMLFVQSFIKKYDSCVKKEQEGVDCEDVVVTKEDLKAEEKQMEEEVAAYNKAVEEQKVREEAFEAEVKAIEEAFESNESVKAFNTCVEAGQKKASEYMTQFTQPKENEDEQEKMTLGEVFRQIGSAADKVGEFQAELEKCQSEAGYKAAVNERELAIAEAQDKLYQNKTEYAKETKFNQLLAEQDEVTEESYDAAYKQAFGEEAFEKMQKAEAEYLKVMEEYETKFLEEEKKAEEEMKVINAEVKTYLESLYKQFDEAEKENEEIVEEKANNDSEEKTSELN